MIHARVALVYVLLSFVLVCCGTSPNKPYDIRRYQKSELSKREIDEGRIVIYEVSSGIRSHFKRQTNPLYGTESQTSYTGLDALIYDRFRLLKDRKFALLTNATGLTYDLKNGIDLMMEAGFFPSLLFEPEHGLFGHRDDEFAARVRIDSASKLRVVSLYATQKRPSQNDLRGLDLIVIDIFNLPVRCYTYISTLTYLMEEAEKADVEVLVLDRPNPYGFWKAEGAMLDTAERSFVAEAPVPFLYSMTPAEYAYYMATVRYPSLKLSIVKVKDYKRGSKQGVLSWINPSPNIPSFESALVYAGTVFFEGTNVSLGRGTTRPFVYSGAPWFKSREVESELRKLNLPGLQVTRLLFTPQSSLYKNQECSGIQLHPVSTSFDPLRTGYEYMRIVKRLHPHRFNITKNPWGYTIDKLWGGYEYRQAIEHDLTWEQFKRQWEREASRFEEMTRQFRIY